MATKVFQELGADHVSWLLAAANNYLRQRRADRAVILLELLGLLDPENAQGQVMLAYAHLLRDDLPRCREALHRVSRLPLTPRNRSAMELMSSRLGAGSREGLPGAPAPDVPGRSNRGRQTE